MPLWKDSNNILHDDMDGEALSLPSWPAGLIQVTPAEADTIRAAAIAAMPPIPDPAAFEQSLKSAIGGILAANTLAVAYPLFFGSIQSQAWDDVQAMLVDAKAKSAITAAQYKAIKAAATQCNIPITL